MTEVKIKKYKPPKIDKAYWGKVYGKKKGQRPSFVNVRKHGNPLSVRGVTCLNCLRRRECKFA